ncbi:MAG: tRNA 2-selenouridine(34) synthase MnmH [Bacteroidota bacterium]
MRSTIEETSPIGVWLDVRSPAEFAQGHVPGALSLPLFTDAERHQVGLCFQEKGPREAVDLAWLYVGPKVPELLKAIHVLSSKVGIEPITKGDNLGKVAPIWKVYCWRGGQRSMGMEMLLKQAGYPVFRYPGGYKAWRQRMETLWALPWQWRVIGGSTGSGKTTLLKELREAGEQVLDLENLASHLGSAFGELGQRPQPSQEHFMNLLAESLSLLDLKRPVWVESESRQIGKVHIPSALYESLHKAPYFRLQRSMDFRMHNLLNSYGLEDKNALRSAFLKIERKMGPQYCQQALAFLEEGDLKSAAELALKYYDRTYQHAFLQRPCPQCVANLQTDAKGRRLLDLLLRTSARLFQLPSTPPPENRIS